MDLGRVGDRLARALRSGGRFKQPSDCRGKRLSEPRRTPVWLSARQHGTNSVGYRSLQTFQVQRGDFEDTPHPVDSFFQLEHRRNAEPSEVHGTMRCSCNEMISWFPTRTVTLACVVWDVANTKHELEHRLPKSGIQASTHPCPRTHYLLHPTNDRKILVSLPLETVSHVQIIIQFVPTVGHPVSSQIERQRRSVDRERWRPLFQGAFRFGPLSDPESKCTQPSTYSGTRFRTYRVQEFVLNQ